MSSKETGEFVPPEPWVLTYERTEDVIIPSRDSEARRAIRKADWDRLKRRCQRLRNPMPWLTVVYSACFGVSASFGASTIPIYHATGLPGGTAPYVFPLYVIVTIFSALLGLVSLLLDRKIQRAAGDTVSDLEEDMKDIESMFSR